MHVTRHTDLDAFLDAVAPMAARGEASASFFTGGAHAMKRTPPRASERVYLATCRGAGTFGAAMLRDEGQVLIGASDPAAGAAFAADLAHDWPGLQGVVGAAAGCDAFAHKWQELTGRAARLRVRMRQHTLVAVNDVPAAPGTVRMATVSDTPWLIEGAMAFIAEVGIPDPPARVRDGMPSRVPAATSASGTTANRSPMQAATTRRRISPGSRPSIRCRIAAAAATRRHWSPHSRANCSSAESGSCS